MTVTARRHAFAGEELVVVAKLDEFDGDFGRATSSLFDSKGEVVAWATSLWIKPDKSRRKGDINGRQ
jgi:hypothetical protein